MFRKLSLATAAAAATLTMVPAAAEASHRSGYQDSGRYQQNYRGGDRYGRYDSRYYGRSNVRYNGRRCKGTTGTIVGGVAGALLGREVTRDRYRGRSGTTGAILGGAFAPTIAEALVKATGSTMSVTWYLAGMVVLGAVATLLLRDRSGIPLGPDHEAEQEVSPVRGLSKV